MDARKRTSIQEFEESFEEMVRKYDLKKKIEDKKNCNGNEESLTDIPWGMTNKLFKKEKKKEIKFTEDLETMEIFQEK